MCCALQMRMISHAVSPVIFRAALSSRQRKACYPAGNWSSERWSACPDHMELSARAGGGSQLQLLFPLHRNGRLLKQPPTDLSLPPDKCPLPSPPRLLSWCSLSRWLSWLSDWCYHQLWFLNQKLGLPFQTFSPLVNITTLTGSIS